MPYATHRGQRIAYEVAGDGPPVVLQHGFLSRASSWHDWGYVEPLAGRYRVIITDSLGHGESDKPRDADLYRKEMRAGDIAAVLDVEGIDRAHYVGYC